MYSDCNIRRSSMIRSEGDSPSPCRAVSMPSIDSFSDAPSEVPTASSYGTLPPSEEAVEEESCTPLSKKHKMQLSEEAFPSEMDDMYDGEKTLDEEVEQFCVADVRRRLSDQLNTPKKMFRRDPEDPSG